MILGRAPFRISFAGGGTDLRAFTQEHPGAVLSTAIDKYMYIMLHPYFHDKIRIKYSKLEDVSRVEDIRHPIVRECLKRFRITKGIEIASIADVPARSGLGSSSAFTVCLMQILSRYKGRPLSKTSLAEEASRIEIDVLREPIGKQDQYASSFGGMNFFRFERDGSVHVEPLRLSAFARESLEKSLLLFFVGGDRRAGRILARVEKAAERRPAREALRQMAGLAEALRAALVRGRTGEMAGILDAGWRLKKSLTPSISTPRIDELYERALRSGAGGGKLLGAGGGGFLLFACPGPEQGRLRRALGLRELRFRFETGGATILHADP